MKLKTIKPRLATLTHRIPTLGGNPAPRPRGRTWQETRKRIQVQQNSLCADCGKLWRADRDHVDHDTPRDFGGSDADENLKLRCLECHNAKTAREASIRAGG